MTTLKILKMTFLCVISLLCLPFMAQAMDNEERKENSIDNDPDVVHQGFECFLKTEAQQKKLTKLLEDRYDARILEEYLHTGFNKDLETKTLSLVKYLLQKTDSDTLQATDKLKQKIKVLMRGETQLTFDKEYHIAGFMSALIKRAQLTTNNSGKNEDALKLIDLTIKQEYEQNVNVVKKEVNHVLQIPDLSDIVLGYGNEKYTDFINSSPLFHSLTLRVMKSEMGPPEELNDELEMLDAHFYRQPQRKCCCTIQ